MGSGFGKLLGNSIGNGFGALKGLRNSCFISGVSGLILLSKFNRIAVHLSSFLFRERGAKRQLLKHQFLIMRRHVKRHFFSTTVNSLKKIATGRTVQYDPLFSRAVKIHVLSRSTIAPPPTFL